LENDDGIFEKRKNGWGVSTTNHKRANEKFQYLYSRKLVAEEQPQKQPHRGFLTRSPLGFSLDKASLKQANQAGVKQILLFLNHRQVSLTDFFSKYVRSVLVDKEPSFLYLSIYNTQNREYQR
jgi:hypothetical protein